MLSAKLSCVVCNSTVLLKLLQGFETPGGNKCSWKESAFPVIIELARHNEISCK